MTIDSITEWASTFGLPAVLILAVLWAAWKWIPAVAKWGAGIIERLTKANETTSIAIAELTRADKRHIVIGESLQHGQRRIARMVILAVPEDKRAEAERHLDEIERILGESD